MTYVFPCSYISLQNCYTYHLPSHIASVHKHMECTQCRPMSSPTLVLFNCIYIYYHTRIYNFLQTSRQELLYINNVLMINVHVMSLKVYHGTFSVMLDILVPTQLHLVPSKEFLKIIRSLQHPCIPTKLSKKRLIPLPQP